MRTGLKERVASRLSRIEAQAGRRMSRGTGVLATIGSTAPFVGLFGTVWGIMNSFIGISQSQTTNLAIVAPGIAEALLATAIGLVAAIPAVVIYNVFARSITGYRQLLADASAGSSVWSAATLMMPACLPLPQRQGSCVTQLPSRSTKMAGGIRHNVSDDELQENHEINVTPFIDVMLVLLIIFMVAAPLATVDINVDLPASTATPVPRPDQPLYLTLKEDKTISVGNNSVTADTLGSFVDQQTEGDKETRVFLQADKSVDYGSLMDLMNNLRSNGYLKIALVGLESAPLAAPGGNAQ